MKKIFLITLALAFILSQCTTTNSNNKGKPEGLSLLEKKCYSCHNPTSPEHARLAPPMIAVKKHYLNGENKSKEAFTTAFTRFLQDPSIEKSKMPNAVKRFGLMPKMNFNPDDLEIIAHYLYNHDIESPEWFEAHYREEQEKYRKNHAPNFLELGQQQALKTKSVLGKNLMTALNQGGASHALAFCNSRAIHLTDSMSQVLGYKIKRVSDKPRNPINQASKRELVYIMKTKKAIELGESAKPSLDSFDNRVLAYYPILTNQMCMNCHAERIEMAPDLVALLDEKYPTDRAVGYAPNELRGIWVVEHQ